MSDTIEPANWDKTDQKKPKTMRLERAVDARNKTQMLV